MPAQVGYTTFNGSKQIAHQVNRPVLPPKISLVQELLQSQSDHF